jgi:hypothetical protein
VAKITIPGTNPEPSDSNILPCLLCTPPLFNAQSHPKLRSRARQTQKSSSHVPPKRRTAEQVRERQFGSAWQASSRGRRRDDEQQLPSAAGLASRRGTNSPLPLRSGDRPVCSCFRRFVGHPLRGAVFDLASRITLGFLSRRFPRGCCAIQRLLCADLAAPLDDSFHSFANSVCTGCQTVIDGFDFDAADSNSKYACRLSMGA